MLRHSKMRGDAEPNGEVEEGHRSTPLCHPGNIAYRVGRSLRCDPEDGRVVDDEGAMKLRPREHAKGWEPRQPACRDEAGPPPMLTT